MEANRQAFDLIMQGVEVAGDPHKHDGREKSVAVIDFEHPEKNDFLAINQFRVDEPGGKTFITPDIVHFDQIEGRQVKLMCRYQQFRAVHKAIYRLRTGKTRKEHGDFDQRGGIIWHTQGSGKSFTTVFLVRKMRTLSDLKRFKVVMVTDRINLEGQLKGTAALTGETVYRAENKNDLARLMQEDTSNIVFAMVQKYQDKDPVTDEYEIPEYRILKAAAPSGKKKTGYKLPSKPILFPVWNHSPEILVLGDEAHRSHTSMLHANIMRALPNCAMIGFTTIERGHTDRFWRLVGRVMPDYEEYARWLNENGADLDL